MQAGGNHTSDSPAHSDPKSYLIHQDNNETWPEPYAIFYPS